MDEWRKKAFDEERRQNGFFLQTIVEYLEIIEERNWRIDTSEKTFNCGSTNECDKFHKEHVFVSVSEQQIWIICSIMT
jgi:hypothetical protein